MRLYFFHLRTPRGLEQDEVGIPFATTEQAYLDVCETLPMIARDLVEEGHSLAQCAFVIANAAGETLFEVPFDELERGPAGTTILEATQAMPGSTGGPRRRDGDLDITLAFESARLERLNGRSGLPAPPPARRSRDPGRS